MESLRRGLCVGITCAVDNQEHYYNSLGEFCVTAQLRFRHKNKDWKFDKEKIYSLVTLSELRGNHIKASCLTDFKGVSRIVDVITTL